MKSRRLNHHLRYTIKNNAVDVKYEKEGDRLSKREDKLATEVYHDFYDEFLPLMDKLPKIAFTMNSSVSYELYEDTTENPRPDHISWGQNDGHLNMLEDRKMFNLSYSHRTVRLSEFMDGKYLKRARALQQALEELRVKRGTYAGKVSTILEGCNSTKQLIEMCPEAIGWIPEVEGCSDVNIADAVCDMRNSA